MSNERDTAGDLEQPLRDQAYSQFTRKLLAQQFRPGQFISQRELVEGTGLPLGAIREILPRLEAEGLLRTIPRRGMQVAPIDLNLIREAFQFRLFMEREAVALFAAQAPEAETARLRRAHEEILELARTAKSSPTIDAKAQAVDWNLHDTIITATDNSILAKAYLVNSVKIRLIHQERFRIAGRIETAMTEHLDIIAAFEARDPQAAVLAITRHIENARRIALDL